MDTRAAGHLWHLCMVESERSGGCLSGRDAVEESLSAKFGGITIGSIINVRSRPPRPPNSAQAWWAGGDKAAWLSRGGFRPLQKVSTNPYFIHTTFPPLFFYSPEARIRGQGPCWACMTGLRTARVPVSAHAGVFDPVQKVSANPYFNHTTFLPLFAFSALGVQGRAEGASVAFGWRRCPSRRTLALQKVSANPYFNSTSSPPLISLRSRRSVGPCWGW